MLEHGKHVLCEKPMGMNVKETRSMVALAREKKLFLMEARAYKVLYHPSPAGGGEGEFIKSVGEEY